MRIEKAKDPGIPANFPYKDQILAEIAEQRRQAAETKEKRKEEKQAAKLAGGDALVAGPSTLSTDVTLKAVHPVASDDEDAPVLLNPDYPHFRAIFEKSDVILHVLDARDPLSFRSSQIESLVSKKPEQRIVFVLNKAGTCFSRRVSSAVRLKLPRYVPKGIRGCMGGLFEGIAPNTNILSVWGWTESVSERARSYRSPRASRRMGRAEERGSRRRGRRYNQRKSPPPLILTRGVNLHKGRQEFCY